MNSLATIQKPKNKRTVLPKSPLIQLYLDGPTSSSSSSSSSNKPRLNILVNNKNKNKSVLPKFAPQDIINQLNSNAFQSSNQPQANPDFSENQQLSHQNEKPSSPLLNKKCLKEKKFKVITRLCLNHPNQAHCYEQFMLTDQIDQEDQLNQFKNRQSLLSFIAKDFFLDCKQRLDANSFKSLLLNLNDYKTKSNLAENENQKIQLNNIYNLIKKDKNLCNKFSAFLTIENALDYNLVMETCQYEKCFEFFHKLELLVPNKCTFKKLIQSVISIAGFSTEFDTISNKIEDIKSRIKSATKNNALINLELDYLFDQRNANLEPTYEKISLVDTCLNDNETENSASNTFNEHKSLHEEYIDLTHVSPVDCAAAKKLSKISKSKNANNLIAKIHKKS